MTASIGSLAKMGFGSTSTATQAIEFISESVRAQKQILETGGIRGTRSHPSERVRQGTYTVSGNISMNPAPDELQFILPYLLGTAVSGTTYALAETIPDLYITTDRISKVYTYGSCKIARGTFQGSQGQLMGFNMDVVGKTETVANAGTFPSLSNLTVLAPWVFYDAVLTIAGTPYAIFDFSLTVDNHPNQRFTNSQTATDLSAMDRVITLNVNMAATATEQALYDAAANYTGLSSTLVFTNGVYILTFTLPKLQVPAQSPVVGGRTEEIKLPLQFTARSSAGSGNELTTTLAVS